MGRVRVHKLRIAVTGLPRAGKTVFSVLLFDTLMNERMPGTEFNAESKSAISVYQAIRNLPADIWPKSTAKGAVSAYTGSIESRRSRIDLEVGDSAGEHWLDLDNEDSRDPGFLEYVLSSHALVHVIPLASLTGEQAELRAANEVDDLRLVARLHRQVHGQRAQIPLLIVLSKTDQIVPPGDLDHTNAGLFKTTKANEINSLNLARGHLEHRTIQLIEQLESQLEREYGSVLFIFSSAPVIALNRLAVSNRGSDLIKWISNCAHSQARQERIEGRYRN
ncbi:hypothetical protein [Lentzea sp. NPDC092896]|uniref:TRAFAC clade GTPase domain-containing protein n=1 Tax=Lentzea sp. NPDC092896 TaxID=3364127 RepID=UPI0037F86B05